MKYKIIKENNNFYVYDINSGNKVKISNEQDNEFYLTGQGIGERYVMLNKENAISEILSSINYLQEQLKLIKEDNNGDYFLSDEGFPIINNDKNSEEFNEVCEKIILKESNYK